MKKISHINNIQRYNHKLSSIFECYLKMKRILKRVRITFPPHSSAYDQPCWRPFWSAKSDAGRANKRTCQTAFARALQDIFETSDRDIKKERATSCPAGGHWRGINHPCEGLHFNARGWISNARAQAARSRARQPALGSRRCIRCNRPAVLCSARAYSVRCQRLSETRIPSLQMQRAPHPASPRRGCGTTPTTKKILVVVVATIPGLAELASFSLLFPSFFHSVLMYVTGFHGNQSTRRLRTIDFLLGRLVDFVL